MNNSIMYGTSNAERLTQLGINLKGNTFGQIKTVCPQCGGKNGSHDLSVNITEGIYQCFRNSCCWSGSVAKFSENGKDSIIDPVKEYTVPVWTNNTNLPDQVVKYFKGRGISQSTLLDLKVTYGKEKMPPEFKECGVIQFNYFRDGQLINIKFRTSDKHFKLVKDAELIPYNLDSIKGEKEIVIVEGEIDALSFHEAGIKNVVSVPNGAGGKKINLKFLDNCDLSTVEKIYIATDQDEPGRLLKDALIDRLGSERCYLVNFNECKDANEYLEKYGPLELSEVINTATKVLPEEAAPEIIEEQPEEQQEQEEKPVTLWDKVGLNKYNPSNITEAPEPVLSIKDVRISTPGGITTLVGQSKAGKTSVLAAIVAGAVAPYPEDIDTLGFTIKENDEEKAVIYIDTEQSKWQFDLTISKILKIAECETTPHFFHAYNLKNFSRKERREALPLILENLRKQHDGIFLMVLDGIADMADPMDDNEAYSTIQLIADDCEKYQFPFITVLHLNPGDSKQGRAVMGKGRGHLGSELERKSDSVLLIEKDTETGITTIREKYLRNGGDMPEIEIKYDKTLERHISNGEPQTYRQKKEEKDKDDLTNIAKSAFVEQSEFNRNGLKAHLARLSGKSEPTANRWITSMLNMKLIAWKGYGNDRRLILNIKEDVSHDVQF